MLFDNSKSATLKRIAKDRKHLMPSLKKPQQFSSLHHHQSKKDPSRRISIITVQNKRYPSSLKHLRRRE